MQMNCSMQTEVNTRCAQARAARQKLRHVLKDRRLCKDRRKEAIIVFITTKLLYGAGTWFSLSESEMVRLSQPLIEAARDVLGRWHQGKPVGKDDDVMKE